MLTSMARTVSEAMEEARQKQKDPASMMPAGSLLQEGLKLWLEHNASGRTRPSAIDRFLYGSAADPEFDAKEHFGINLRPSAQSSMEAYSEGLAEGGVKAEQEAQSIADRIKALLGFTVSPVIAPTYAPPAGNGGSTGNQTSLPTPGGTKVTQNIYSPNSRQAAMRAQREQNRAVRQASARTFGGTGTRSA